MLHSQELNWMAVD